MDKMFKKELIIEMRKAVQAAMEANHEIYVSGDRLATEIECFKKSWLKNYGQSLPRTRAVVKDKDGVAHEGNWVYPLHQIKRMVANDEIKHLKIENNEEFSKVSTHVSTRSRGLRRIVC